MTPLLVIMHEDDAGPGRLTPALPGPLDLRRPHRGDPLPGDLHGHAGLLVLGGAMGAHDDDVAPWLPATRTLLAQAVAAGLPTVGICLGAQLLAVATGGRVERGDAGPEVGMVDVELLPEAAADGLLGPSGQLFGARFAVPQWHQDAIVELPGGAVLLATGRRYPHQAFRLGPRAWGVQYHPEVTAEDFQLWMDGGHASVRAGGLDPVVVMAAMRAGEVHQQALAAAHGRGLGAVFGAGS